jgi:hypothetical protein
VESVHVEVPFSIFLLEQNAKLVLTDIDGTITESNIKGLVFPQFGIDAHQVSCSGLIRFKGFILLIKQKSLIKGHVSCIVLIHYKNLIAIFKVNSLNQTPGRLSGFNPSKRFDLANERKSLNQRTL